MPIRSMAVPFVAWRRSLHAVSTVVSTPQCRQPMRGSHHFHIEIRQRPGPVLGFRRVYELEEGRIVQGRRRGPHRRGVGHAPQLLPLGHGQPCFR